MRLSEYIMVRKSGQSLATLVRHCRAGDKKAWESIIELVSPVIFSICSKMRLSREESFDIFGQVCYLLLSNIDSVRSAEKLLSYVGTITKREVYALHRRLRLFEYLDDGAIHGISDSDVTVPDQRYDHMQRSEMLMKALAFLPERDRELIHALFLDTSEPTYEEIANRLGIPVPSIGATRARSLTKLHRIIKMKKM